MFGSKLRSWMENHIGRPRKKGSKHKQQQQQLPNDVVILSKKSATLQHHANGHIKLPPTSPVLGSSSGSHGIVSSPVRRREVSPIQCHTPSRYGWQSPDQDTITSPKSDNLLYAPQRYVTPQQQHQLSVQTAPNSKHNSSADKSPAAQVNCSSSSISSLSWSTGSKEPSSGSKREVAAARMDMESQGTLAAHYDYNNKIKTQPYSAPHDYELDEEEVHYEEVGTLLRRDTANETITQSNSNTSLRDYQRPHSANLGSFGTGTSSANALTGYGQQRASKDEHDSCARYGRLLPSRLPAAYASDSVESLHVKSECYTAPSGAAAAVAGSRLRGLRTNNFAQSTVATNRSTIGLAAPGAGVGPPHSLSSPESAYSTGYSTDGTSPGTANYNPPEYYINMRTGTHYFPKSINSLAIEAQRYKFGLNRIEEMSPMEPLPKTSFGNATLQQRNVNDFYGQPRLECAASPLALHNVNVQEQQPHKLYESPSPRQRCRIRTNPWYSNAEANVQNITATNVAVVKSTSSCATGMGISRMELDTTSTASSISSGIKSCNELKAAKEQNRNKLLPSTAGLINNAYESSASSSSLTEVENGKHAATKTAAEVTTTKTVSSCSPLLGVVRRKQQQQQHLNEHLSSPLLRRDCNFAGAMAFGMAGNQRLECQDTLLISDDEATLNEMIGKFDESYIYEKETDILSSDSDPTDCASELDTGQDAGDECDTDEMLDIDFIDTSSIQEIMLDSKDMQRNLGTCYYSYAATQTQSPTRFERRASMRSRRSSRSFQETGPMVAPGSGASRRRKRFMKTRKKSTENREKLPTAIVPTHSRESRSVGGTPVCLRRNQLSAKERIYKTSPLSNRSNSLVFTEHKKDKQFMTIAESEKALLKADMEADIKYRQLIMEAESLLESMKNSLQSIPRDTPVASPRRLNPLANKRIEMLKQSEVEPKKQPQRTNSTPERDCVDHELAAAINKRIELLKFETASAPNSPKMGRCSPRKTHLTNFINQNAPPEVPPRKLSADLYKAPQSPQLQLNGRRLQSPVASPQTPRRNQMNASSTKYTHSSNWHNANINLSDSDQECIAVLRQSTEDMVNHNFVQQQQQQPTTVIYNSADYNNQNVTPISTAANTSTTSYAYCPHSEPLKRKVYCGSSTFERIKKNFDLELEIPKQTANTGFLNARQQQSKLSLSAKNSINDITALGVQEMLESPKTSRKQQLILSTIVDLKRSLEHQSYELCGLNEE